MFGLYISERLAIKVANKTGLRLNPYDRTLAELAEAMMIDGYPIEDSNKLLFGLWREIQKRPHRLDPIKEKELRESLQLEGTPLQLIDKILFDILSGEGERETPFLNKWQPMLPQYGSKTSRSSHEVDTKAGPYDLSRYQ